MENVNSNEIIKDELTVELGTKLLVFSFRFSQGDPALQGLIFRYLHLSYPHWHISDEMAQDVYKQALDLVNKIVVTGKKSGGMHQTEFFEYGQSPLSSRSAETSTQLNLDIMKAIFNDNFKDDEDIVESMENQSIPFNEPEIFDNPLPEIIHRIAEKDNEFMAKGRKMSYFQHFIVGGSITGISPFDRMFRDAHNYYEGSKHDESKYPLKKDEINVLVSR